MTQTPEKKPLPGGHGEGEDVPWDRERYGSRLHEEVEDYGSCWDRACHEYGAGQDEEPGASDTETPGGKRAPGS